MPEFGLIGRTLKHSYSPEIHKLFGDYEYNIIELEPESLDDFFRRKDFKGINVTIPYKETAIKYCDELSSSAKRIGAVNTIVKQPDGTLFGDNTDYDGFKYLVKSSGVSIDGKQCFIFGTGGASLAVRTALEDLGALRVLRVSRKGTLNYSNIYEHVDADILINTTPVGMFPKCAETLVNMPRFQRVIAVFDIIYNPARTQFMLDAQREYAKAYGGLPMLVAQAARSSELFTGNRIDDEQLERAISKINFDKKNIMLIGMPGCGKTTIGRIIADKLGREFLDIDEMIAKKTGRTPEEIIRKDGETIFREIETSVLEDISILSGKVISCGGGIISPKANRYIMKRNSTVVWIQRDENLLATDGRPLSQIIGTHELYLYRQPLYIESSDYNFVNNTTPEECADKIIKELMLETISN